MNSKNSGLLYFSVIGLGIILWVSLLSFQSDQAYGNADLTEMVNSPAAPFVHRSTTVTPTSPKVRLAQIQSTRPPRPTHPPRPDDCVLRPELCRPR